MHNIAEESPAIIYISNPHFDENVAFSDATSKSFSFVELQIDDWDRCLTPWPVEGVIKGREFQGQARSLLDSIVDQIVPELQVKAKLSQIYLVGYSLAGLFSLWALYECDIFDGAACCSGSLWYPQWKDYAMSHSIKKSGKVYLSLGDKEKNTKNLCMKSTEENMLFQYELLQNDISVHSVHFEMNPGGHFSDMIGRVKKGIKWLI